MSPIEENLQAVRRRISEICQGDSRAVTLVAVSKLQPLERLREAFAAGHRDFGENYVQEAVAKMDALAGLEGIVWHFIGHLQGNKAKEVAQRFDWVHGVDRERIADLLSRHRPADRPPLNVCIQVNISEEATKGGVAPGGALTLARHVAGLPRLRLRGLMAIPEPSDEPARQRAPLAAMKRLFDGQRAAGFADWDTLSMGMSADLEAAIEQGATMVRIGTALFGERGK